MDKLLPKFGSKRGHDFLDLYNFTTYNIFTYWKKKSIKIKFEIRQYDSMCHSISKLVNILYLTNNL